MMFHCVSPEIGRYLAENVREETLKRHADGLSRFPLWWLVDAPYFQRDDTGDEGVGLVQPARSGARSISRGRPSRSRRWLAFSPTRTRKGAA
jgi:hypothetical protein